MRSDSIRSRMNRSNSRRFEVSGPCSAPSSCGRGLTLRHARRTAAFARRGGWAGVLMTTIPPPLASMNNLAAIRCKPEDCSHCSTFVCPTAVRWLPGPTDRLRDGECDPGRRNLRVLRKRRHGGSLWTAGLWPDRDEPAHDHHLAIRDAPAARFAAGAPVQVSMDHRSVPCRPGITSVFRPHNRRVRALAGVLQRVRRTGGHHDGDACWSGRRLAV
jgi:hypothetical protein